MKDFIKIVAILALIAIGFGPILTALADVFWWIFTGHILSGLDWHDAGRYFGAMFWTVFIAPVCGGMIAGIVEAT